MIRFGEKAAFLSVVIVVTAALLMDTADMRNDVALVPKVIGWPLLVLSALALLAEVFPVMAERAGAWLPSAVRGYLTPGAGGTPVGPQFASSPSGPGEQASLYRFTAWLALSITLTYVLGIMWAMAIGMFLWVKLIARGGWLISAAMAAGALAFNYGVFVLGFDYEYFLRPVMQ